ncbi:MAG: MoaD/ThiS family protein [Sedimentibacter sp.]
MKIKIKYYGINSNLPLNIELPEDSTVEDALYGIIDKTNDSLETIVSSVFLVNKSRAKKDTVLNDGDELLILYMLGGG